MEPVYKSVELPDTSYGLRKLGEKFLLDFEIAVLERLPTFAVEALEAENERGSARVVEAAPREPLQASARTHSPAVHRLTFDDVRRRERATDIIRKHAQSCAAKIVRGLSLDLEKAVEACVSDVVKQLGSGCQVLGFPVQAAHAQGA